MKLVVVKFTLVLPRKTGKTDESKNSEKWNEGKSVEKLRKKKTMENGIRETNSNPERKKYIRKMKRENLGKFLCSWINKIFNKLSLILILSFSQ